MIGNNRISTSLDTGRLGEAISRPGIDPRCWVSLAVVEDIAIDPDEGIFVDVYTMPGREQLTARLVSPYIRDRAGLFFPIKVGDEVIVGWPSGDSMLGICVLGRVFSPACKPSLQFAKNPELVDTEIPDTLDTTNDIVLVVEEGQSVRIRVSTPTSTNELTFNGDEYRLTVRGDAKAVIKAEDNAKVYLGDDPTGTQPLALANELSDYFGAANSLGTGLLGFLTRMATTLGYSVEPVPSLPTSIAATKVEGK